MTDGDWTEERLEAWDNMLALLEHAVKLAHMKRECQVLMFPDASDLFWGCCVTQVPREDMDSGIPVEDMRHEPLRFVSGASEGHSSTDQ